MNAQCQTVNTVTTVNGGQGIVVYAACVQLTTTEIKGVPLTNILCC